MEGRKGGKGGREEGREKGREEGRERGREGEREGGREGGRKEGREEGRKGGREGRGKGGKREGREEGNNGLWDGGQGRRGSRGRKRAEIEEDGLRSKTGRTLGVFSHCRPVDKNGWHWFGMGMKFTKRVVCQKKHLPKKMPLFHERIMLGDSGKAFQKHPLVPGY